MAAFQNHQWSVDDWGLSSIVPGAPYEYNILGKRLLEMNGAGGGDFYDWPLQIAEKTWSDLEAFIEAFEQALKVHQGKYTGTADPEILAKSYDEARRRKASYAR